MKKIEDIISPIIDNRRIEKLSGIDHYLGEKNSMDGVFAEIFDNLDISRIKICTGYFSPHVWKLVGDLLEKLPVSEDLPVFELLIGSEVKEQSKKDLQKWFNEQLQGELENLDLNIELQRHIRSLISFLQREDVFVGLQNRPFVHGKFYWLQDLAIVGSSNFTYQGFRNNTELNVPIFEKKQIKALSFWFDSIFKKSNTTYKVELIEALKNCKLGTNPWKPFDVYMKILYEVYKPTLSFEEVKSEIDIQLTIYQQEGVSRLLTAIDDFGGVMLADSVGLGKSFQGLEVIRKLQVTKGKRQALIICPAQLKTNWENMVVASDVWAQVYSMETLALRLPKKKKFDIVVIDESHNFRNSKTLRYKQLELLLTKSPNASILLLTATPINTSLNDLYSQMMIVSRSSINYQPFHNIGIFDLKDYFKAVGKNEEDIGRLRDHLIVSRSRREIRLRQKLFNLDLTIGGEPLRFPERELDSIYYNITDESLSGMSSEEFYQDLIDLLDKLDFPYYNLEKYSLEEKDDSAVQLGMNLASLMKVLLLKRMESSIVVFSKSLEDQMKLSGLFLNAIKRKVFLKSSVIRKVFDEILAEVQDSGENEIDAFCNFIESPEKMKKYLNKEEFDKSYDVSELEKDIKAHNEILLKIQNLITPIINHEDQKLASFFATIDRLEDKKILIFSYFKDTANYVFEKLIEHYPTKAHKFALITGNTANRNAIVHKFAPLSNPKIDNNGNVKDMDKEDQLQLLLSTDVLSEGQNLQDASVCINFDLHWNPVRIIQRVGRIDRLKSPHKNIQIFNAFPEKGLETLLSLVSRLVARLRLIDQTLELDGAILTGDELTKKSDQLSRLKKSDMSVLDELESEAELLGDDEVRDLLIKTMFVKGDKYFKTIPIGVHSGILKNEQHSGVAVVIRAFRKNIPSYLWGFEPDKPEEYSEFLKNGIVTSKAFIQNLIKCSESEDRYLPESENIDGALFRRVMNIAFKLKQLLWASGVARKIEEKLPEGNKIFFDHIKIAQKLGRKMPLKFPDISNVKKYIKLTKLSIIGKELEDLPKKYRIVIKNYKDSKKLKRLKERSQGDKDFVNETIIFIKILDKYITGNKLLEKGEEKEIELKNKFELIGFLRIYNTDE